MKNDLSIKHKVRNAKIDSNNVHEIENFHEIADNAPVMIWITQKDGYCTYLNKRWYEYTGQTKKEALGFGWLKAVHPADAPGANETFLKANKKHTPFRLEYRLKRRDGSYYWVIDAGSPRFTNNGDFNGYIGSVIDINERKTVEDAFFREREKLDIALRNGQMGVYEWYLGAKNVWWSPEVYPVYGVDPRKFIPTVSSIGRLILPEDREILRKKTEESIRKRKPFSYEYRIRRPDGEIRWIVNRSNVGLNANGKVNRIIGVALDITEQKLAERRLEVLVSSIDDHLVTYDKKWQYTFVNEAAARVLGKKREGLLGKCIWDLFPDAVGNQYYRELHTAARTKKAIRSEHYYPPFDTWFENNIYPFEDGVTVFSTDITKRKKIEEALKRSERLKDEFIGIASHELKTPVTSIKAYAQVLQQRFIKEKNMEAAEFVGKMDFQINKLTNLISDLLDVTKIESGKLQFREDYFSFNDLINEVIEETQRTTINHKIETKLGKSATVYADRERIGQVVTNFLTNAIKYSPRTKRIIVKTNVLNSKKSKKIQLSIQDFGIGLADEDKKKVFERFFRGSDSQQLTYPGLGLGLYISGEIIRRHKGKIWVKSKKGKGSTFFFTLPIK